MTYELKPCPKPASRVKAPRTRLKRTRMKCGAASKRRGKSSFPKQRDRKYRRWIREQDCLLTLCRTVHRLSSCDFGTIALGWHHCCWGPIDPAHVGKHQATGAPDFGAIVPLCRAAHQFYDEHRDQWPRVTQISHREMACIASGLALKYVESGGTAPPPRDRETHNE